MNKVDVKLATMINNKIICYIFVASRSALFKTEKWSYVDKHVKHALTDYITRNFFV